MKNRLRKENGITLIALIITVIILLILAGVAIASLGNSGLFSKSKDAVNKYSEAEKNEGGRLNEYLNGMNEWELGSGTNNEKEYFSYKLNITDNSIQEAFFNLIELDKWNYDITVDWGDGDNKLEQDTGIVNFKNDKDAAISSGDLEKRFSHKYSINGEYEVKIYGTAEGGISLYDYMAQAGIVTEITSIFPKSMNVKQTKFEDTFFFTSIESIPEDLFKYCTEVEVFNRIFNANLKLKSIPENLFKYNVKAKSISGFSRCKDLMEIPKDLFKYNFNLENVDYIFDEASKIELIPEDLFKYNIKLNSVRSTFYECTSLKEIPNALFANNLQMFLDIVQD